MRTLARKGAIEMLAGASRGIRLLAEETGLPLIGRVAAGSPLLAVENIEMHCRVDAQFFKPRVERLNVLRTCGFGLGKFGL